MLSFALKDAFPSILFSQHQILFDKPKLDVAPTIPECNGTALTFWLPRENWRPLFFPDQIYPQKFTFINQPHLFLHYYRTEWFWGSAVGERKWVFSLPMPERGHISTGQWIWDEELTEFRRSVSRILGKLMTNRLKHWHEKDKVIHRKDSRRYGTWAGLHVLDWCRDGPRRMINGEYRPCDDWELTETRWYSDLRERVAGRFGENFGEPPPPGHQYVIEKPIRI
jgi:hypothetical protein